MVPRRITRRDRIEQAVQAPDHYIRPLEDPLDGRAHLAIPSRLKSEDFEAEWDRYGPAVDPLMHTRLTDNHFSFCDYIQTDS